MKVVVGLGNPGRKYNNTRHNIGFEVLAEVARRWQAGKPRLKFEAEYAEVVAGGQKVLLLSPLTYMNASGKAVIGATNFFGVTSDDVLVVCDDFNLPLGKIRIRRQGSDGGHNGLASIVDEVGSNVFPRLRMGIGTTGELDAADYVLSPFLSEEMPVVDEMVERSSQAVFDLIIHDLTWMMNHNNL